MSFSDIAAMVDLMGQRFRAAGLNPPRLVLTQGDVDKLIGMVPGETRDFYTSTGDARAALVIAGVKVYAARERESER